MPSPAFPLTVFYDASCPLCASEMHALKARDRDGRLLLADCSAADFDVGGFTADGATREAMLARIHARDAAGRWLRGVEVFVEAYRAAGFPRIARMLADQRIGPLAERLYPWIARHRHTLSRLGLFRVYDRIARRDAQAASACVDARACQQRRNAASTAP